MTNKVTQSGQIGMYMHAQKPTAKETEIFDSLSSQRHTVVLRSGRIWHGPSDCEPFKAVLCPVTQPEIYNDYVSTRPTIPIVAYANDTSKGRVLYPNVDYGTDDLDEPGSDADVVIEALLKAMEAPGDIQAVGIPAPAGMGSSWPADVEPLDTQSTATDA